MAVLTLRVVNWLVILSVAVVTVLMVMTSMLGCFWLNRILILSRAWTVGTLRGRVFPVNSIIAGVLFIVTVLCRPLCSWALLWGVVSCSLGMIRRTDTLYTLPRSVLLLLAILVSLSMTAIFVWRRVVLTSIRLKVWPRNAVHMVIIGRRLFTVTFMVDATVRRLVTLMLNICRGNRRPTVVRFAGFSTVVATVIMLGCLVVIVYTLLENIEA